MPKSRTSSPRPGTPSGAGTSAAGQRAATSVRGAGGWSSGSRVAGAAVAALAVLAGAVALTTRSGSDASTTPALPAGPANAGAGAAPTAQAGAGNSGSARVEHVHGLGVDPRDGALYAGTHYGLFRLPAAGGAARVGDRVQDYMGFTVAGPGHYLASGHPGRGQGGPSSLGLIESTDGGASWTGLSLAGEADFHSLEARHGRVYGLNSLTGELLVSEDKRTWDPRSRARIADFAVSPTDPDVLLATTAQGPARSEDGGRSWAPLAGAPVLQLVSWAEDGTLVGIAPDGSVHASSDTGRSWTRRGRLGGAPHALTATSDRDVYAATDGAILASADGGRSFTTRYRES